MTDKCKIYAIANKSKTPFLAGYECQKARAEGRINRNAFFNPYEPDTADGEDFIQGMYQHNYECNSTNQI